MSKQNMSIHFAVYLFQMSIHCVVYIVGSPFTFTELMAYAYILITVLKTGHDPQ